tara:strand:+ start:2864 stop:3595 length:732 start_codon:yes stop_codon:yes gene_type:complete
MSLGIEPHYVTIGNLDADWCLEQCREIINTCPMYQKANNSQKFFRTYHQYRVYKDSQIPIVKKFVEMVEEFSDTFKETFPNKEYYLSYIYLAHTIDSSEPICVWHKDRAFFDGQFHITVLGNGNIKIKDGGIESKIKVENGTVWYMNGTSYLHTIESTEGERFELLIPNAPRKRTLDIWERITSNTPERWLNPHHPDIAPNTKRTENDHTGYKSWSGLDDDGNFAIGEKTEVPEMEQRFYDKL